MAAAGTGSARPDRGAGPRGDPADRADRPLHGDPGGLPVVPRLAGRHRTGHRAAGAGHRSGALRGARQAAAARRRRACADRRTRAGTCLGMVAALRARPRRRDPRGLYARRPRGHHSPDGRRPGPRTRWHRRGRPRVRRPGARQPEPDVRRFTRAHDHRRARGPGVLRTDTELGRAAVEPPLGTDAAWTARHEWPARPAARRGPAHRHEMAGRSAAGPRTRRRLRCGEGHRRRAGHRRVRGRGPPHRGRHGPPGARRRLGARSAGGELRLRGLARQRLPHPGRPDDRLLLDPAPELFARLGPAGWGAAQHACGWAVHGLCLSAAASGLFARPVRAFKEIPTQRVIGLDEDEAIVLSAVVGVPQDTGGALLDLRV